MRRVDVLSLLSLLFWGVSQGVIDVLTGVPTSPVGVWTLHQHLFSRKERNGTRTSAATATTLVGLRGHRSGDSSEKGRNRGLQPRKGNHGISFSSTDTSEKGRRVRYYSYGPHQSGPAPPHHPTPVHQFYHNRVDTSTPVSVGDDTGGGKTGDGQFSCPVDVRSRTP